MQRQELIALVTAARAGDQKAMNELFNCFYNDVYYFALKTVKDSDLACDITQETFVSVITNLQELQEPAAFVSWMKKITYSQCTRYFRKKKEVLLEEDEEGGTAFDILAEDRSEFIPDDAMEQEDFRATILAMIDTLSEEQRSAVLLYYYDELPVDQVAQIQGVSAGTVKSRLNYARKAIRRSVEDYEKKNGLKLRSIGILPLVVWLLGSGEKREMPVAAAKLTATGIAGATGVAVSVGTGASVVAGGGAVAASAGAAAGFLGKLAALPLAAKISGGLAALLLVGGTGTALVVHNLPPDPPALVQVEEETTEPTQEQHSTEQTDPDIPAANITTAPPETLPEETDPTQTTDVSEDPTETEPEVTEPEVTEPEVTEPEVTEPEVTEPEATEPEATEPEVTEPEVTEPEVTEPEVTEPEVTEPEVTEPEVTEPEVTEPEVTEPETQWERVPDGYEYVAANGKTYRSGAAIEQEAKVGDEMYSTEYRYVYESGGWHVYAKSSRSSYGALLSSVNGVPLTSMASAFSGCTGMVSAPAIPSTVTNMEYAFWGCTGLKTAPAIPSGVRNLTGTFRGCSSLTTPPSLPSGITSLYVTFENCSGLQQAPGIPSSVKEMNDTFNGCSALKAAPALPSGLSSMKGAFAGTNIEKMPTLPSSVKNLEYAFANCKNLVYGSTIPASVTNLKQTFMGCSRLQSVLRVDAALPKYTSDSSCISQCFAGTTGSITLTGSCPYLQELTDTAENGNVTVS